MKFFVCCLAFALLFSGGPGLSAPVLVTNFGSEAVYVDAIDVQGQTGSSVSLLRAVLEIPIATALPRSVLEQKLSEARLRILGFGYYREVLLHLVKGSQRGHYRLIVQADSYTSAYTGAALSLYDSGSRNFLEGATQRGALASFFWGDRNWRDSGLWLDSEIGGGAYWLDNGSDDFHYKGNDRVGLFTFNLFAPNVDGGRFVFGARLQLTYVDTDLTFALPSAGQTTGTRSRVHDRGLVANGVVQAGIREGLATVSAVSILRQQRTLVSSGNSFTDFDKQVGVKFTYSEKSYLALVEPGLDLQVDALRDVTLLSTNLTVGLLYTWMPGESYGVTPGVRTEFGWYNFPFDVVREQYVHLDWVTARHWVVSAEPRWVQGMLPASQFGEPGITLTARYAAADSLYSLSLILGHDGLENSLIPGPRELQR